MPGGETPGRFERLAPRVGFTLAGEEESELWEDTGKGLLRQGIVLKNRPREEARAGEVIRVKGEKGFYEVEVVAINDASDLDPSKCNYVIEVFKRPA